MAFLVQLNLIVQPDQERHYHYLSELLLIYTSLFYTTELKFHTAKIIKVPSKLL